jgi:hypothetical protein
MLARRRTLAPHHLPVYNVSMASEDPGVGVIAPLIGEPVQQRVRSSG